MIPSSRDLPSLAPDVRRAAGVFNPHVPLRNLDIVVSCIRSYGHRRGFRCGWWAALAFVALLLAAIGLCGVF